MVTQLLARGMTSPLREMTAAARSMATGDYSRRVQATSHDEVGELAVAFNRMAEDLGSVDRQRRELVANVSHELRTPVTALRATLENLVDGVADPDPATLAHRAGADRAARHAGGTAPRPVAARGRRGPARRHRPARGDRSSTRRWPRPGWSTWPVDRTVVWEVDVEPDDLPVRADPARLHQVVANLLDNAARHSPPGGRVRVSAARSRSRPGAVVLEVERRGPRHRPGATASASSSASTAPGRRSR